MIAEIFGYAIAVALLVGLAAAAVELLLAELRQPRRFAWLGAFVVALAFPPFAWLLAPEVQQPLVVEAANLSLSTFESYTQFAWGKGLLWLWVVATTVLSILYAIAWLRLAVLARRWSHETSDADSVVVADDVGPAVFGVFRPRIVLPRWLMDAPAEVRRSVVAHELEHIAARDQACIVAAQLVTILLPWNLPLWWFVRRLRAAIEIDCDARVLRRGVDPVQYADTLLAVGRHRPTSAYVAATLIEPVTQLERRIRIMLTQPRSASIGRVAAAVAVGAALAACATQLEPPVVITRSTQDTATSAVSRIESGPGATGLRVIRGAEDELIVEGSELVMRVEDPARLRVIAQHMVEKPDSLLIEGVQIVSDGVTISASRALVITEPTGGEVWTLTDAKIVRAATSAE